LLRGLTASQFNNSYPIIWNNKVIGVHPPSSEWGLLADEVKYF